MGVPSQRQGADLENPVEVPDAIICSHEPRPGKFVFTERDNTDGWIATDLAVELEP